MSMEHPLDIDQARAEASLEAMRQLKRLHVDQTRPIDIFAIIEAAGIWLFFQPMKDVQGVYLRDAETGRQAILINSRRPLSLQRLTAAHEYGHCVLEHSSSLDEQADIEPSQTKIVQEAAAQVFANDFLMPLRLVERLWKDLGLPQDGRKVEPHQVYLLSLHLGVSYSALIYQLVQLKKIPRSVVGGLARYQPRRIKQELLGRNIGPVDSWADVWPLDEKDNGRHLHVRVNDELNIGLSEIPSTGYRWDVMKPEVTDLSAEVSQARSKSDITAMLADLEPGVQIALLDDEFEGAMPARAVAGAGGRRFLKFRVLKSGVHELELGLRQPWLPSAEEIFTVRIEAIPKATGDEDNGIRQGLKQPMAVSASLVDQED